MGWVTIERDDGEPQHVFIGGGGKVLATRTKISKAGGAGERGKSLAERSKAAIGKARARKMIAAKKEEANPEAMSPKQWADWAAKGKIVGATGKFNAEENALEAKAHRGDKVTPLMHGRAAGYSEQDIAKFYLHANKQAGLSEGAAHRQYSQHLQEVNQRVQMTKQRAASQPPAAASKPSLREQAATSNIKTVESKTMSFEQRNRAMQAHGGVLPKTVEIATISRKVSPERKAASDRLDAQIAREKAKREETSAKIASDAKTSDREKIMGRALEAERLKNVRAKLASMGRKDYSKFPTGNVKSVMSAIRQRKQS